MEEENSVAFRGAQLVLHPKTRHFGCVLNRVG
jgi:hypothetical protein